MVVFWRISALAPALAGAAALFLGITLPATDAKAQRGVEPVAMVCPSPRAVTIALPEDLKFGIGNVDWEWKTDADNRNGPPAEFFGAVLREYRDYKGGFFARVDCEYTNVYGERQVLGIHLTIIEPWLEPLGNHWMDGQGTSEMTICTKSRMDCAIEVRGYTELAIF